MVCPKNLTTATHKWHKQKIPFVKLKLNEKADDFLKLVEFFKIHRNEETKSINKKTKSIAVVTEHKPVINKKKEEKIKSEPKELIPFDDDIEEI